MFRGKRIVLATIAVVCGGAGLLCFVHALEGGFKPDELGEKLCIDAFIGALLGVAAGCVAYLVRKRRHGRHLHRGRRLELSLMAGLLTCLGAGAWLAVHHCQSAREDAEALAYATVPSSDAAQGTNQFGGTNRMGQTSTPDKPYRSGIDLPRNELNRRPGRKPAVTVLDSPRDPTLPPEPAIPGPPEEKAGLHGSHG
ncbi:MAG: hypothetical protein NTW03_13535 [Verrucomicrobia bacterium]|nr:hypothetical protein [Verrucomicrobiota bacterium]